MFRLNPAEIKKQLRRLGIKNVEVETLTAEEVEIRLEDGRILIAPAPQLMIMRIPGGSAMIQIVAERLEELRRERGEEAGSPVSEEDVRLVAEQTGVSLEEARKALEEAEGDIAAAIMLIEERKRAS